MKRFLTIFPVPKYLSLGATACAIDHDTLRSIEFNRRGRSLSVSSSNSVALPSPLDKALKLPAEDIRKAISVALAHAKKNNISIVIPEQSTYVFLTEVPVTDPRLVREAISFKLEEHVPIALPDSLFEYDIIAVDPIKNSTTAAVRVVPKQHVEYLVGLFSSEKVLVARCDTESKALAQALAPRDGETYLIIHIGRASTVCAVVKDGVPLFSSTLSVGSLDITAAVAKVLSIPVSQVAKLRSSLRLSTAPDKRLLDALVPTLAAIRDEANKVMEYWNSHIDLISKSSVKSVFLSGEDVVFPSVMAYLELSFTIPIVIADVWRNTNTSTSSVPPLELEAALGFAPAIGAASHSI